MEHKNIDWNNLGKIRLKNSDKESFIFHDIVKLIIVKLILNKSKNRNHQFIYTEYKFNGRICDILHYNRLTKEEIVYEIQSKITSSWIKETTDYYKNLDVDLVIIDLNKLSNDIPILIKQLKELII